MANPLGQVKCFVTTILFGMLLFQFGCRSETVEKDEHIPPKECVILNDSALMLLQNDYYLGADSSILDKAESLLEISIACDSDYYQPYLNLVNVLNIKGDYGKVINTSDLMSRRFRIKSQSRAFKYYAFIDMGDSLSAQKAREEALAKYNIELKREEKTSFVISDKILYIMFVDGVKQAIAAIDTIKDNDLKQSLYDLREELESMEP